MTLVMLGDEREQQFDHLVIECTGVAEPREIRDNFVQMSLSDHMVNDRLRLGNLVTVVDSTMFLEHYGSQDIIQVGCQERKINRTASSSAVHTDL